MKHSTPSTLIVNLLSNLTSDCTYAYLLFSSSFVGLGGGGLDGGGELFTNKAGGGGLGLGLSQV